MEDLSKGYDASPPQNGIIFGVAMFTIFLLVGVKFMLDSYFSSVMDSEYHDKIAIRGVEQVSAMRAKEAQMLGRVGLPMQEAAKVLAERGRSASPVIAPKSGQGMAPVAGWTQLKREPEASAAPAAPEAAPAAESAHGEGAQH